MYDLTFSNSLVVMIVGMSIVFLFLVILIISVRVSHVIIRALKLDKEPVTEPDGKAEKKNIIAAISAAVKMYENDK